jgi:S1-C subfamily serine protease
VITDFAVAKQLRDAGKETVDVAFSDQRTYTGRVVASDERSSTAVLRLDGNRTFPSVRPGNPADLAIGHLLMTIGNSFGSASESPPAVTLGVIAGITRDAQGNATRIETSAATNPGQEGGPFFDLRGDLVGLEYSLPAGDDLAMLTPIDLVIAHYADVKEIATVFEKPRTSAPPVSLAESLSKGFAIAARRGRSGVVTLVVKRKDENAELPALYGLPIRKGPISGTIVDASGIVVAQLPAFQTSIDSITAHTADGRALKATLLCSDHKAGLAVLQLDLEGRPLPPLEFRQSSELTLGQFCLALGAAYPIEPGGAPNDGFVTTGILSAMHQLDIYRDALQTDAGIGAKNAGGALIDLRSRLIGVVLPPAMPFGANSGLGFALPAEVVLANLPRWKAGVSCEPGVLGVMLSDSPGGLRIDSLTPGQPAEKAGLRGGDLITHLDGQKVKLRQEFTDYLAKYKCAGDELKVTVARGAEVSTLTAVLAKRS